MNDFLKIFAVRHCQSNVVYSHSQTSHALKIPSDLGVLRGYFRSILGAFWNNFINEEIM